jgi:hypothetical protein
MTLFKNFDYLLPSDDDWATEHITLPQTSNANRADGNLLQILSIVDLKVNHTLEASLAGNNKSSFIRIIGDPRSWYRVGNKIIYDVGINDDRWFKAEYYRTPKDLLHADESLEIPEIYHWAVVLWGIWWGMKDSGESSAAYSAKKDFNDEMISIVGQYDIRSETSNPRGEIIYRRGED